MKSAFRLAALALFAALALPSQSFAADPAAALYASANAKQTAGDLDGAIADYTSAIKLNPKYALAYYNRSTAYGKKGDFDAALADASRAITLDPARADFYANRGIVKQLKGDLPGAVTDFTHAIKADPKYPVAYMDRGNVEQTLGHLDPAIADFNQAIVLDPKYPPAWFNRASAEALARNWKDALADFRQFSWMAAGSGVLTYQDYTHLYIWLMSVRLGDATTANRELSGYLDKRPDTAAGDWFSQVAGCLLGSINETDLLIAATNANAARDSGQHCEASYYIGIKMLFAGDNKTAADYFRKSIATGRKEYFEYQMARSELKALGEK